MEDGLFYWDHSYNKTILLSLVIVIGLFTSLRLFSGIFTHIDPNYELTQKDNGAFGVSLAGMLFGITLILGGVIPKNWSSSMTQSLTAIVIYGLVGLALLAFTRRIFDKLVLPNLSIRNEIVRGNMAAAIIDAGNVIAAAVVITTLLDWVTLDSVDNAITLLLVYGMSQALLTVFGAIHVHFFTKRNQKPKQQELIEGNTAIAMRFAGRRIGIAYAITGAANIMVAEVFDPQQLILSWAMISIVVMVALTALSWVASHVILFGMDVNDEVGRQRNVAIGTLQGVIYISLGILLSSLIS